MRPKLRHQAPWYSKWCQIQPLRWRHNGRDIVSNHQPHDCLLNRLFRRRSKKTSKFCVTGPCVGNSPGTGEFPAQMTSNAENISIWWRHHAHTYFNEMGKPISSLERLTVRSVCIIAFVEKQNSLYQMKFHKQDRVWYYLLGAWLHEIAWNRYGPRPWTDRFCYVYI